MYGSRSRKAARSLSRSAKAARRRLAAAAVMALALVAPMVPGVGTVRSAVAQSQATAGSFEPLTFTGELNSDSLRLSEDGSFYQVHEFSGEAGQTLVIEMVSEDFDTFLFLLDASGTPIAQNDDSEGTNSRIAVTLPGTGRYTVIANSFSAGETGRYQLMIREGSAQELERGEQLAEADRLNQQVIQLNQQGRYSEAIPLAQQALAIRETALGENHPDVATSLNNLAELYRAQGNYAAAEPLYQRSLSIRETALGETHPDVAQSLNNLALLYQAQGNYAAAELLYQRSLSIRETALGENHPDVATSLNNLAGLYQVQGNSVAALTLLERAAESQEAQLDLTLAVISETRRRAYLTTLSGETDAIISFNLQAAPEAASLALTTLLRRKGRVLDATAESYAALRQQLTPENQALLDELIQIDTQRANLFFGEPVDGQAALLDSLAAEAEVLQNQLAQVSAAFRTETQPVTLDAVQQQIPTDGALVELVRYRPFDAAASWQERFGDPRYAAYVLLPSGEIRTVDLGDAAALDAQVFTYLDALRNPRSNIQPIARALDAQLMQPIRALTDNATHLLLSPDGALNLIPFAALMDETNTYLTERYTFTYLTSGRDLLRMDTGIEPGQGPVIVANPDYGATELATTRGANPDPTLTAQRSSDFSSLNAFALLPGTELEADAITPLLPTATRWDGNAATEAAIKQVQAPSILHLATHGFFLQDQDCLAVPDDARANATITIESTADCVPTPRNVENPLLRSGLVDLIGN